MTDPRFDPVFQRGYSGPDPELVVREPGGAPSADPAASWAPPEIPAETGSPAPAADRDPGSDPTAPAAIRNPSRLALLLLGLVLLIAAASTLYSQVQHPQGTSTTVESQFVQGLVSTVPPVFALTGLVCLILWLALGALDHVDPESDRAEG